MSAATHPIEPIVAQPKTTTVTYHPRVEGKSRTNLADRSQSTTLNLKLGLNQDTSLQVREVRDLAQTQHPVIQKTIE